MQSIGYAHPIFVVILHRKSGYLYVCYDKRADHMLMAVVFNVARDLVWQRFGKIRHYELYNIKVSPALFSIFISFFDRLASIGFRKVYRLAEVDAWVGNMYI
jgi:hypothetical protein